MNVLKQLGIETNIVVKPLVFKMPEDGIIIFTDGSSKGNGSRNAKSGCAAVFPLHPHLDVSYTLPLGSTNNRAEYTGLLLGLQKAKLEDPRHIKTIYVYTDSKLLIDSMTKWIRGWKNNGWKKSDGKQVLNQDLLKQIDEMSINRKIIYKHVLSHTGKTDWMSVWNAKADEMANNAANLSR
jgi:ribonuclease HI